MLITVQPSLDGTEAVELLEIRYDRGDGGGGLGLMSFARDSCVRSAGTTVREKLTGMETDE